MNYTRPRLSLVPTRNFLQLPVIADTGRLIAPCGYQNIPCENNILREYHANSWNFRVIIHTMIQERDILLQASNLGRRDGRNQRLEGLDLVLRRGQVLGLLGVNGAGKSTTLALLSGALRPTSGRVEILGIDLHRHPSQAKRHLGLLPERPPLYPNLTVDENLDFAARLRGMQGKAARSARERIKRQLDLGAFGARLCGRLSKGMAQRVGIAQALVHEPQVVILDEPTAGLDPAQARELRTFIGDIRSRCGVLLATHILRDVEALCEEVLILRDGRLAARERLHEQNRVRIHLLRPPPRKGKPGTASGRGGRAQPGRGMVRTGAR